MQRVYQAADLVDAQLMLDRLLAEGIECAIQGSYLSGAIGELPADATPSVWVVNDEDAARARQFARTLYAHGAEHSAPWVCTTCGERHGGDFQLCWNCGGARPD